MVLTNTAADDDPTASDKEKAQRLGEIEVRLSRARIRQGQSSSTRTRTVLPVEERPIAEKALKGHALSSRATFGQPEVQRSAKAFIKFDYTWGDEPIATYIFKHRSRKDLQIEGIIERSPSHGPLEDRDLDDLQPAEALELIRRMRDRDEVAAKIKQEGQAMRSKSGKRRLPGSSNDEEDEASRVHTNKSGKRPYVEITSDDGEDDDEEEGQITVTDVTTKRARVIRSMADQDVVDLSDG